MKPQELVYTVNNLKSKNASLESKIEIISNQLVEKDVKIDDLLMVLDKTNATMESLVSAKDGQVLETTKSLLNLQDTNKSYKDTIERLEARLAEECAKNKYYVTIQETLSALEQDMSVCVGEKNELKLQLDQAIRNYDNDVSSLKNEIHARESEYTRYTAELTAQNEQNKDKLSASLIKVVSLEEALKQKLAVIKMMEGRLDSQQNQIGSLAQTVEEKQFLMDEVAVKLDSVEEKLEIRNNDFTKLSIKYSTLLEQVSEDKSQASKFKTDAVNIFNQNSALLEENKLAKSRIEELENNILQLAQAKEDIQHQLELSEFSRLEVDARSDQMESEMVELEEKYKNQKEHIEQVQATMQGKIVDLSNQLELLKAEKVNYLVDQIIDSAGIKSSNNHGTDLVIVEEQLNATKATLDQVMLEKDQLLVQIREIQLANQQKMMEANDQYIKVKQLLAQVSMEKEQLQEQNISMTNMVNDDQRIEYKEKYELMCNQHEELMNELALVIANRDNLVNSSNSEEIDGLKEALDIATGTIETLSAQVVNLGIEKHEINNALSHNEIELNNLIKELEIVQGNNKKEIDLLLAQAVEAKDKLMEVTRVNTELTNNCLVLQANLDTKAAVEETDLLNQTASIIESLHDQINTLVQQKDQAIEQRTISESEIIKFAKKIEDMSNLCEAYEEAKLEYLQEIKKLLDSTEKLTIELESINNKYSIKLSECSALEQSVSEYVSQKIIDKETAEKEMANVIEANKTQKEGFDANVSVLKAQLSTLESQRMEFINSTLSLTIDKNKLEADFVILQTEKNANIEKLNDKIAKLANELDIERKARDSDVTINMEQIKNLSNQLIELQKGYDLLMLESEKHAQLQLQIEELSRCIKEKDLGLFHSSEKIIELNKELAILRNTHDAIHQKYTMLTLTYNTLDSEKQLVLAENISLANEVNEIKCNQQKLTEQIQMLQESSNALNEVIILKSLELDAKDEVNKTLVLEADTAAKELECIGNDIPHDHSLSELERSLEPTSYVTRDKYNELQLKYIHLSQISEHLQVKTTCLQAHLLSRKVLNPQTAVYKLSYPMDDNELDIDNGHDVYAANGSKKIRLSQE